MARTDLIDEFVATLARRLGIDTWLTMGERRVLREIEDHLREAASAERAAGAGPDAAMRRAIERFGTLAELVPLYEDQMGATAISRAVAISLLGATLASAFIASSSWLASALAALFIVACLTGVPRVLRWPAAIGALLAADWTLVLLASMATRQHGPALIGLLVMAIVAVTPAAYAAVRLARGRFSRA